LGHVIGMDQGRLRNIFQSKQEGTKKSRKAQTETAGRRREWFRKAESEEIEEKTYNSIQFNSCLFMCKLNSTEANYKVSMSTQKYTKIIKRTKHKI
jgi:hypothetical protein